MTPNPNDAWAGLPPVGKEDVWAGLPPAESEHPLGAAYQQVAEVQPDHAAKVLTLAQKTGEELGFIDKNVELVARAANAPSQAWWTQFQKDFPKTAALVSDPMKMAVAKDDLDNVSAFEGHVQDYSFMSSMWRSLNTGLARMNANVARIPAAINNTLLLPGNLLAKAVGRPDMQATSPAWLMDNPAASYYDKQAALSKTPDLDKSISDEISRGNYRGAARALAAQFVSNAPSQALLLAGTFSGAGAPALIGAGAMQAADVSKRAHDSGADPAMATLDAIYQGTAEGVFERFGTYGIAKHWERAIAQSFGKDTAARVMRDLGKTLAHAFIGEGVEEGQTQLAQDFSDYVTGINPDALTGTGQRALDAALIGGVSGLGMTAPAAAMSGSYRAGEARRVELTKQAYLSMGKTAEASKLRQRLPEAYRAMVESASQGSPVENIFIPIKAAEVYFQGQADGEEMLQKLGISEQYAAAQQTGMDLAIPLATWADNFVGTEHYAALADDIKFQQSEMSVNELKGLHAEVDTNMKEASFKAGYERIRDDYKHRLMSAGYTQAEADKGAQALARIDAISAVRDEKPLEQVQAMRVFGSESEYFDSARLASGESSGMFADEMDSARAAEESAAVADQMAAVGGLTPVMDAVRKMGGLDLAAAKAGGHGGELANISWTGIFRKDGRKLDHIVESLAEQGLLQEADANVLFEKLDDESRAIGNFKAQHGEKAYQRIRRRLAQGTAPDNTNPELQRIRGIYAKDIDDIASGKRSPGRPLYAGTTSGPLRAAGADSLPVTMDPSVVTKALSPKHRVTIGNLKDVPWHLEDPLMVFESDSKPGALVALTEMEREGKPIVVAVHLNERVGHLEVNDIASVHAKDTLKGIQKWLKGGKLKYWRDQKSATDWLQSHGLYLPAEGDSPSLHSIKSQSDVVKAQERPLSQGGSEPRAFYDPAADAAVFGKAADASSIIHEGAHRWLNQTFEMLRGEAAPEWRQSSAAAIKKWWAENPDKVVDEMRLEIRQLKKRKSLAGLDAERLAALEKAIPEIYKRGGEKYVASLVEKHLEGADFVEKEVARQFHELFARGFEAFFRDGKLPAPELRGVFQQFRRWLLKIYKTAQDLRVNLSPDVQGVFARMLATDTEIAAAEEAVGGRRLTNPQARSMQEQAHEAAVRVLMSKQMEELRQARLKMLDAERVKAGNAARAELAASPLYNAMVGLGRGSKAIMGNTEAKHLDFSRRYAERYLRGHIPEDSIKIFDWVAESNGFSSGDELAKAILKAPNYAEAIARKVEEHMAQFPDLMNTEAIKDEAQKAIHSDATIEALAVERMALGKTGEASQELTAQRRQRSVVERQVMRERAKEILAGKSVREASVYVPYFTAERNAAVKAAKARALGDQRTEYKYLGQQMLNHALALESIRLKRDVIDPILKNKEDIRERKAESFKDQRHADQIESLLRRFGFTSLRYYRLTGPVEALHEYALRISESSGIVQDDANGHKSVMDGSGIVNIAKWILESDSPVNYRDITVSQLKDVDNAFKNILHIANMEDKAFVLEKGMEISAIAVGLHNEGLKNAGKPREVHVDITDADRAAARTDNYDWRRQTIDTVAFLLDGSKENGPFYKVLKAGPKTAADLESNLRLKMQQGMEKLWGLYGKEERQRMFNKLEFYEEIGVSMTGQKKIAMAMNTGTQENRWVLFGRQPHGFPGDFWGETPEEAEAAVMSFLEKHMTAKDWNFVQGVWDLMEQLRPEAEALHMEMTGFSFGRKELSPFSIRTQDGKVFETKGGYYPLKRDPRSTEQAAVAELGANPLYTEHNPAWSSFVSHGYTKNVTGKRYTISLDLGAIEQHFADVTHDIAFRGVVVDLNRILANQPLMQFVKRYHGEQAYRYLRDYVRALAVESKAAVLANDAITHAMHELNTRAVTAMVIGRVSVLTQNLANAALGTRRPIEDFTPLDSVRAILTHGLGDYWIKHAYDWKGARALQRKVWDKSVFMRERREKPDYTLELGKADLKGWNKTIFNFAVNMIGFSDDLINVPMWIGAHEKKLAAGMTEKRAVDYADLLIERMTGSPRKYDVAPMLRGSDSEKFFTKLYSFWSTDYQSYLRLTGKLKHGSAMENAERIVSYVAATHMFLVLSALLSGSLPKDDEGWLEWQWKMWLRYPVQWMPFMRTFIDPIISQLTGQQFGAGYRIAPIGSVGDAVIRFAASIPKALDSEEYQPMLETGAKVAAIGIPYFPARPIPLLTPAYPDQFNAWFWNAYDYFANEMEPRPTDIMRRRPKMER